MEDNGNNKIVKVTPKLVHYIPCSISQVRKQGWSIERVYEWGKISSFAKETINIEDLIVLLGVLKAFQDNIHAVQEGGLRTGMPTLTLKLNFNNFMYNYLQTHNKSFVEESLKRLISWKVVFSFNGGGVNLQEYLVDFKIFEENRVFKVILTINKPSCQVCSLLIYYDSLKKLSSNLARALFIYIEGCSSSSFYQDTLERVLDLDKTKMPPAHRRTKIKDALNRLKEANLISDYKCEKKAVGYLFTVTKILLLSRDTGRDTERETLYSLLAS